MSNYFCHVCGGLVDLIKLQPSGVRFCDCANRFAKLRAENAELAEQNKKMREALEETGACLDEDDGLSTIISKALALPDLSTPAINRIKAEAYRECAEICRRKVQRVSNGNGISYQSFDPASVMAEYCEETIRAAADELEGMK